MFAAVEFERAIVWWNVVVRRCNAEKVGDLVGGSPQFGLADDLTPRPSAGLLDSLGVATCHGTEREHENEKK